MVRAGMVVAIGALIAGAQLPPANYDESRVPHYTLPPLLVHESGTPVRTPADWNVRRSELRGLLTREMFGRAPDTPVAVDATIDEVDRAALGGIAIRKQVSLRVAGHTWHLLLYLPARPTGRVPVFVSLGFDPNHFVHADPRIRLSDAWAIDSQTHAVVRRPATDMQRGSHASRWPLDVILGGGFGLATVYYGDVEPDAPGGDTLAVRGTLRRTAVSPDGEDAWGAVATWAWGLSRIADYLVTDPDVDASRLAVIGHSRLGKAAIWAAATDARFALAVSNESGEGGAAISRRVFGETVANLNGTFPHWFSRTYTRYNGHESTMPFDAHMVLALIAPRPLYVTSAEDDHWADPKGEFLGAVAASAVWEFLGVRGLGTSDMPPADHPVGQRVRYHVRRGPHDITRYDWIQYVAFASAQLR